MLPPWLGALETVSACPAVVTCLPAAWVTPAVTVTGPSLTLVEFHVAVYGAEVLVATTTPSTRKATLATPSCDEAFAVNVTCPLSVAPAAGPVSVTVGDAGAPASIV